ncbi:MAG: phosphate signaling complex protein PhoU [Clostridiales bacterium]|nr:phosphate signaling complex protein PhoU [Clostridiales bacterium]
MRKNFDDDLQGLSGELVKMAAGAEEAIRLSVRALTQKDAELARAVIEGDGAIDDLEKSIESRALKIIIKYQPVARDLRSVTCALKMITDIERIADQASDISSITLKFIGAEYIKDIEHIPAMAAHVCEMVHNSVRSFINRDETLARRIKSDDDVADAHFIAIKDELIAHLKKRPDAAEQILYFMMIAKYLERIGDHAVNISEWVVFDLTGVHKNSRIL